VLRSGAVAAALTIALGASAAACSSSSSKADCSLWTRALAAQHKASLALGPQLAQQQEREAIYRGWVDLPEIGGRVDRPKGCKP
jgi:hypothetical protein